MSIRGIWLSIGFFAMILISGLITGAIFGIAGSFIYLIVVYPVLMGLMGGYIVSESAKSARIHNKVFIIIGSILAIVVMFGMMHYLRYVAVQVLTAYRINGDFSYINLDTGAQMADALFLKKTGYSGFIGYLMYRAQMGLSIGKLFSSNRLNQGPIFTWLVWAAEILVAGWITLLIGKTILKQPFCEHCNGWYAPTKHLGSAAIQQQDTILEWIRTKNFGSVSSVLCDQTDSSSLELYLQSCPTCTTADSFLKVSQFYLHKGKMAARELAAVRISPGERAALMGSTTNSDL